MSASWEGFMNLLKLLSIAAGLGSTALAIYISYRLTPILLKLQAQAKEIDRIDKDREEEDKRLKQKIEDEGVVRQSLAVELKELEKALPNFETHKARITQQVEAFKGEIRLDVIEKLVAVSEANMKFREELRKDVSGKTESWTREGITREVMEKKLRDLREDMTRDIRRIESKVDERR